MDVLFFLRPDGQHNLANDINMAVFLLINIMCDVVTDSGSSFLLNVRWTIYVIC